MELYCTRPSCPRPRNVYPDLDNKNTLTTVTQKFCTTCGMPLILAGRYLPTRLLGKGGFGTAFLAIDRYTPAQRQCVVKQFLPAGKFTPAQLQTAQDLFAREAAVLEELGHQHNQIPDLFAFFPLNVNNSGGKPEDFFYLVQEFIDGEDLEKELARQKFFSEEQALEILESMLPVLEFVHQRGVIHRDIKPSNIMRDRRGRLYLLDFGAVKQATAGNAPQQKSTGIYSLGFAPPEQMAGDQVFPATDIYALAVTVISLLTGKEPQDLLDSYTGQWQWRNYVQVSDRLGTVLDKMLRPIPSERYASATEVIAALAGNNPVKPITSPTNNPNSSLNTKPNTKPNTVVLKK
jgi:serine/threonine protein kinase